MFDSLDEEILEDDEILSKIKKLLDTTSKGKNDLIDENLLKKLMLNPKNMDLTI